MDLFGSNPPQNERFQESIFGNYFQQFIQQ